MYKKRSEIVLQMDEAIDEFMMFLSTKPIVTWSICTGHGLLSILTWKIMHTTEWIQDVRIKLKGLGTCTCRCLCEILHYKLKLNLHCLFLWGNI